MVIISDYQDEPKQDPSSSSADARHSDFLLEDSAEAEKERKKRKIDDEAEKERKKRKIDDEAEKERKNRKIDDEAEKERKNRKIDDEAEKERKNRKMDDEAEKERKKRKIDDEAEKERKKRKIDDEAERKVREIEEREKRVEEVVMKDAEEAEKEDGKKVPNQGKGLDLEKYSWTQTLQEVTANIPVPKGTKGRFVVCDIKKKHLKVGLKGQPPVVEGELYRTIKPDDCYWCLEDRSAVSVLLTKHDQMEWWKCLLKGDPEIDTQKVEPENRKLSDLDPETRQTVEKMMFDERQKAMGLPTSATKMLRQEILKQLLAEHPELDFSKLKIS